MRIELIAMMPVATILMACTMARAEPGRSTFDWMSGYWLSCEGDVETAESWIGAGGDTLLGVNVTSGPSAAFEFLPIAQGPGGTWSYFSMPDGRSPATEFPLSESSALRAIFSNPEHDFPQRILYWREGEYLYARIEGEIDGSAQSVDWSFQRAAQDSHCRNLAKSN
jgi:hypothetical protein